MDPTDLHAHGLAGDEIAPDWPPLTPAEVNAVLARFPGLHGPMRIEWRSPRPFSAAARVTTREREVFIKRHHRRVRDAADLATEHAVMSHLRVSGIPIPDVLVNADGTTVVTRDPWVYEVHALAAGMDLYRDRYSWEPLTDVGQARTAGRMLAQLHRAAADCTVAPRDAWILVARDDLLRAPHPVTALTAQMAARPALADYLARHVWPRDLAPLFDRQQALQPRLASLPRLWTHNDWHVSNLCWSAATSDAAITAVIDFGLASPTFALFDLATAIERNAIAWLHLERGMGAVFAATARALIAGYAEVTPLTSHERALIADLLPIVHLDYALSEIEYFHGITHADDDADVAYRTFLLGHAHWFNTAPGRALLDALRDGA